MDQRLYMGGEIQFGYAQYIHISCKKSTIKKDEVIVAYISTYHYLHVIMNQTLNSLFKIARIRLTLYYHISSLMFDC